MVFRPNINSQTCFVLMPFSDLHNDYFKAILAPAAESSGLHAIKADQIYGTGAIIRDIWESIWSAQVVIADVTGKNPNVNYELGLCHALGVPTILISQEINDVPFDYRHRRCILYNTRAVDWQKKLESDVRETISAVLSGKPEKDELEWPYDTNAIKQLGPGGPFVRSEAIREPLLRGIAAAQEAVAMALGPHGTSLSSSSAIFGVRMSTRGLSIVSALSSDDPYTQLGLDQVRELAREVSAETGDGTKSAVLLFCEMVRGGYVALQDGALLRELTTEMDVAVETAIRYLRESSLQVDDRRIQGVAQTAAMGDPMDAHTVVSALSNAGVDGVVYLEDSPNLNTDLLVSEGMHFGQGFISDKFITDEPRQLAILENVHILLCSSKISSMADLLPVLEQVASAGHSVLVVAGDIDGEALATLEVNHARGTIRAVAVKAAGFGARRELILEDIAVASGGSVISHSSLLPNTRLSQLGFSDSVEVSRDNTWLIHAHGDPGLVESRASGIRKQISVAGSDFDGEKLRERLASLVGATVAIRVGGVSEVDRSERKGRIESSMHSTRAANSNGVLFGGGNSLWGAQQFLARNDQSHGATIVSAALAAPLQAQVKNSRVPWAGVLRELEENSSNKIGFNAIKRAVSNLDEDGILDPTNTAIRGLQIAFAHARKVLQTGAWEIASPPSRNQLGT
jgi:chaperonin GroEL